MAVFAVTYRYVEDPDLLDRHRVAHRAYLGSLVGEGGLVASGPMNGGADASALLIFDAESTGAIEAALDADPFWTEGLISSREIREWTVVLGSIGPSSGR